ncbi:MAG: GH92 family glycosyl hydrolase [Melioribacteraceae bacterium]|nr:GH92 family glycosyl hydrolase [Melioribacteraceae bacterium]MCF8356338.1 GH92 family glycosyl hydrolase [Melioribacteraceae bacterium]MCF8395747.1 GH92 family glycosyl hydrolase [Melioribacteraceae bacterium]MCF8420549.1 GH92 family glycosyl hydrolase [Melioribacteraceae bacterium]
MKSKILIVMVMFSLCLLTINAQEKTLIDYVDPFIGTGGHGHTFPGATTPFGMVQLSPDTDIQGWDWCSGYHISDDNMMGFSHTHLSGTGASDYGDIRFMPFTGETKLLPGPKDDPDKGYRSRFNHQNESARPGYYSVLLDDYNIRAELSVTTRAGFHKYDYPENETAKLIIDLNHGIFDKATDASIEIVDNKTVRGFRRSSGWADDHTVYFYARFSKPIENYEIYDDLNIIKGSKAASKNILGVFSFDDSGDEILIKVGISHVSQDGAEKNLDSEIDHWDFQKTVDESAEKWNKVLSKIIIEDNNESNKEIFYTALYHSYIAPNIFSDVDGKYVGMNHEIYQSNEREIYTVYSLWDTYRALHPLFTLIEQERTNDLVHSLIEKYKEGGLLPVWELAANETYTMIGYHSVPVIVDAYMKGIRDYNIETAYEAMKHSAEEDRDGLDYYKSMGVIPFDKISESVSKLLEYCYDDWCIAQMAKALGKDEDYQRYTERSKYYLNVYDKSTGFMRAKRNGMFEQNFDPKDVSFSYTEANAWQYAFYVPHDIENLIKLHGGAESFTDKLDQMFSESSELKGHDQPDVSGLIGQYAHGNEPSHHMAYLYNYAGKPWKTQEKIDYILKNMYTTEPDGLSGNEDCGQMSAWFVLSAMGFYPVAPGDNNYIIGRPLFDKVTINLENGNKFIIESKNNSAENYFIQNSQLNGDDYSKSFINHEKINSGGELIFTLGSEPNEQWGIGDDNLPPSRVDFDFLPSPLIEGDQIFRGEQTISLRSDFDVDDIYYTLDNSIPGEQSLKYESPFKIDTSINIWAVSYKEKLGFSKPINASYFKIIEGQDIKYNTDYSTRYTGGGTFALIDGVRGNTNFRSSWQGFHGIDADITIDLGEVKNIESVALGCLQEMRSWIFFPKNVMIYTSDDGDNFVEAAEIKNEFSPKESGTLLNDFSRSFENLRARFVRVNAVNMKTCPEWHVGAGGKAWVFIDEVVIKTEK